MSYTSASNTIKSNSISDINTSIKNIDLTDGWSGPAATSTNEQFTQLLEGAKNLESNLESFSSALDNLEVYKSYKEKIDALNDAIESISVYDYDSKTGEYVFNSYNASIKSAYEKQRRDLMLENKDLREQIVAAIEEIGAEGEVYHVEFDIPPLNDYSKLGELLDDIEIPEVVVPSSTDNGTDMDIGSLTDMSLERVNELAEYFNVTPEYVAALNLPADWKPGDSILPPGVTPDQVVYGSNGYPVIVAGVPVVEAGGTANVPIAKYYQNGHWSDWCTKDPIYNRPEIAPGNAMLDNVYPGEFNSNMQTFYGPRTQGTIRGIQNYYLCNDGLYRDSNGYIVCALNNYNTNLENDMRYNWPKQTGVHYTEEEIQTALANNGDVVATVYGLARGHDYCGSKIKDDTGIWIDIYSGYF